MPRVATEPAIGPARATANDRHRAWPLSLLNWAARPHGHPILADPWRRAPWSTAHRSTLRTTPPVTSTSTSRGGDPAPNDAPKGSSGRAPRTPGACDTTVRPCDRRSVQIAPGRSRNLPVAESGGVLAQGTGRLKSPRVGTDSRRSQSTSNEATFSAASCCRPFTTCEYVSSVMLMLEWPSRSWTTFGCTPAASASVADVCRRS